MQPRRMPFFLKVLHPAFHVIITRNDLHWTLQRFAGRKLKIANLQLPTTQTPSPIREVCQHRGAPPCRRWGTLLCDGSERLSTTVADLGRQLDDEDYDPCSSVQWMAFKSIRQCKIYIENTQSVGFTRSIGAVRKGLILPLAPIAKYGSQGTRSAWYCTVHMAEP